MPIKGRDGKYRPLGYTGEPMNQFQYDRYMERNKPPVRSKKKETSATKIKQFNRKSDGKGSDYKPGTRVPAVEESLMKKDNLG